MVVSPFSAADKSDLLRSSDASNDVFALSIDEVFAEENVLAGRRVSCECNACRAVVTHVSENHRLNVYSGSPVVGEAVHFAVNDCSFVHPAAENRVDCAPELFFRICRELFARLLLDYLFVVFNELFQVFDSHFEVAFDAVFVLESRDCVLEVLAFDSHNDISVHLHETAEAVPCETGIGVCFNKTFKRIFIETEVKNRVHHARHRGARAAADRKKKRILRITELFAHNFFNFLKIFVNLLCKFWRIVSVVFIVNGAHIGCNRETGGNRNFHVAHFGEVGALSAESVLH